MADPREGARAALVTLFERYMSATGSTPTATSKRFAADGSFFARLPDQRPQLRKANNIVRRFAEAWPSETPWPEAEIPRPLEGEDVFVAVPIRQVASTPANR